MSEPTAAQDRNSTLFQEHADRPGAWHSHKDGLWLFVWNDTTKRWECSGCGVPWA